MYRAPIKFHAILIEVFARLFQKAARAVGGDGRAPQSAKSHAGVFFLIAFSFALASAKEKAGINTYAKHVCWRRRDRVRLAAAVET